MMNKNLMKNPIIFALFFLIFSCNGQTKSEVAKEETYQPQTEVELIQYEELLKKIHRNDDVVYIANFWATWCKPCIEELPDFMEVNNKYKNNPKFKMYLVSIDFPKKVEQLVIPFIEKNKVTAEVILLDDSKRMDEWINAVSPQWSGSIPATAIYKNNQQIHFTEGTLNQTQLEKIIQQNL